MLFANNTINFRFTNWKNWDLWKRREKMQIVPTLNFGGNCREAIHMYEKAFNGGIDARRTCF